MSTKRIVMISSLVMSTFFVKAQSLSPQVISSTGGYSSSGSASLSATTGEMTMVSTFSTGSVIVTQGFQQPEDFNVGVAPLPDPASGISFGPNPSSGTINLFFESTAGMNMIFSVLDLKGALLYELETVKYAGTNFISFDLSVLPAGSYLLSCKLKEPVAGMPTQFASKFTIVK